MSNVQRDETERNFLIEVVSGLEDSLELSDRLRSLTGLVVPRLADWCVIASRNQNEVTWLAAHHTDPLHDSQFNGAVGTSISLEPTASAGLHRVLTMESPELVPEVTPEWLAAASGD